MRYHCVFVFSLPAAVLLGGLAKPLSLLWDDMRPKHSWNAVPKNWVSLGRPHSDTTIDIYIALKSHRENALIDLLYEVSEPGRPRYGAHLSREQVAELVAPHPETLELLDSWLEHHGVLSSSVSMTHGGDTLMLKGVSMTQANALLNASYQLYRHIESSETVVRTVGYALPAALHGHVLTVVPTTAFFSPPTQWQTPRNSSGRAVAVPVKSASGEPAAMLSSRENVNYVTPSFLRWLYDTENYSPSATNRNMLAVAGYLGDYPSLEDLATFMRKYRSTAADASFVVLLVNGGKYDPNDPHPEASLNIQYAEAMAYPTPQIFYSSGRGRSGTGDWFVTWLGYLLLQPSVPQTIIMSYAIVEDTLPREYAMFVCYLFARLGVRGVSVLVASGNSGVGQGDCVTNDGSVQFRPVFPATCPWVTAVGGTTDYEPEVGASLSGGGFSNYFLRESYQEQAVSAFLLDLGNRYQGLYNISGRGIPDIAAQAIGFRLVVNGNEMQFNGGATPVVAGIISLLNDYLLSRGLAPLGFLNPWLYGRGSEAVVDIISGSNLGCNTDGFSATVGWDPVTGLGTPAFDAMRIVLW